MIPAEKTGPIPGIDINTLGRSSIWAAIALSNSLIWASNAFMEVMDINYSDWGEIHIHPDITVTVWFIVVVNLDSFNQCIHKRWRKLINLFNFTESTEQ